ncbi:D-alanyl-D-alanine carboxypeptidase family protein [Clostridium cylindrosporum]|uniref:serine-type D-Ala-D-Ala carboxypeptidase n=1 Tax=Clostridium cylindrosporum DSM 605 TaxID=1121307 RepID=A0A0J8D6B0_CLOCY|nr:D-alanyl-D-alanine carboxypeptidase family protein [Clostridium cylindrosporum]KMT21630.1 D-alanyl-D-alanine carboxypeptidase DacC [Clostridium cylindrosporum DSM 605]
MSGRLKKPYLFLCVVVITLFYIISPVAVVHASIDLKDYNTKAAVLIDATTGKVLYENNKDGILGQASVTKLMTYYVIRDYLKKTNTPLSKKITVDADFSIVPEDGTQLRLKKGDVLTIKDLLESLLIMSANDSAIQLEKVVEHSTGQNFLNLMNSKVKELGLNRTNYINTSGLTQESKGKKVYNTTTAYETAVLAKKIIDEYPDTLKITSKRSYTYKNITYPNTNKLLPIVKSVDGLKTGHTTEAGYCLASTEGISGTSNNNKPFRLIAVTLGSNSDTDRTNVNKKLLKYGEVNFENRKVISKKQGFNIKSKYHKGGIIPSSVGDDIYYLLKKNSKVETKATLIKGLKGNIKKGEVVGSLSIKIDGSTVEEDLISTSDIKKVGILKRIGLFFEDLF